MAGWTPIQGAIIPHKDLRRPILATLRERGVEIGQIHQPHLTPTQDQRQAVLPGIAIEAGQAAAAEQHHKVIDALIAQEPDCRGVERLNQSVPRHHPAAVRTVIVLGHVPAVVGGNVEQHGLGDERAVVERLGVEERLERRPGRATGDGAVVLSLAHRIEEPSGADHGSYFARAIVDDHDRGLFDTPGPQGGETGGNLLLGEALHLRVERGLDSRRPRRLLNCIVAEVRSEEGRLVPGARQGLTHGGGDLGGCERPAVPQLAQNAVARTRGAEVVAKRIVLVGRSRQGRQEGDLPDRQLRRGLSEVDERCRPDAFDIAAVRGHVQVHRQQLALRVAPGELQRPKGFPRFSVQAARLRLGHTGDLHGNRRCARHAAAGSRVCDQGARDSHGVHAGMAPEPAILGREDRLHGAGRHFVERDGNPQLLIRRKDDPHGVAVAIEDHDGRRTPQLCHRKGESEIEQDEERERREHQDAQSSQRAST